LNFARFDATLLNLSCIKGAAMFDWLASKVFGDTLPPDELIHWYFDTYAWLFKDNGGFEHFSKRPLVLPTNEYFPLFCRGGEDLAEEVFGHVRRYTGIKYSGSIEPQDIQENPLSKVQVAASFKTRGAAGTFRMSWDGDSPVITYDPRDLESLPNLIATFAHELSHFYHSRMAFENPGGKDAYEPATDLTAIYLGFGVFQSNSAFNFSQKGGGWSSSHTGYLSELSMAYVLAIFTELQNRSPQEAAKHLKPNPRGYYNGAIRDLRKRWLGRLEMLRAL
jgi:hypothetical protein